MPVMASDRLQEFVALLTALLSELRFVEAAGFREEAGRQASAVATSGHALRDQAFIAAISEPG